MSDTVRVLSTLALKGAVHDLTSQYQAAGGARIDEDRETAILGRYRDAFGDSGPALADAVLRICRG